MFSTTRRDAQRAQLAGALGDEQLMQLAAEGAQLDLADAVALTRRELARVIDGTPTG